MSKLGVFAGILRFQYRSRQHARASASFVILSGTSEASGVEGSTCSNDPLIGQTCKFFAAACRFFDSLRSLRMTRTRLSALTQDDLPPNYIEIFKILSDHPSYAHKRTHVPALCVSVCKIADE